MLGEAITSEPVAPAAGRPAGQTRSRELLFRAGTQLCAVPLDRVIEVMRLLPIKPVSSGPRFVRGLCIIRGAPVPVVDTGLLIGDRSTDCQRLITVRTGSRTVALAAETVLGIWTIDPATLSRLPPLLADGETDVITAIASRDSELLVFLQTTRVIPDDLHDHLLADGARL